RQQFGAALGTQQALQHRAVEMFIALEQARSLTLLAAARMAGQDTAERRRACTAAKAQGGAAPRVVGEQAVQLHGGIGLTDALPVSHYFQRATTLAAAWGDVPHHLERFAALPGFRAAA